MQAIKGNRSSGPQDAGLLLNYSTVSTMKLGVVPELWLKGLLVFNATAKLKSSVVSIRMVLVYIVSQPNFETVIPRFWS